MKRVVRKVLFCLFELETSKADDGGGVGGGGEILPWYEEDGRSCEDL